MLVLGIETSCDETAAALYDTEAGLLGHALHSQVDMHQAYGGVVPELASRDHIRRLLPLTDLALRQAQVNLREVDAIAYTRGPGLAGALLVGAGMASALGLALGKPLIGVHHLEGHLLSPLLSSQPPSFPFLALLVSGGHTMLLDVQAFGHYTLLGETVDDAAGEAFDKSAKLLGLGYPGGPELARLAEFGNPQAFDLPRPKMHSPDLDFSFAGLKTAVLTKVRALGAHVCEQSRADLAAAAQDAITDVLVHKTLRAQQLTRRERVVIAGGVGANRQLREKLAAQLSGRGVQLFFPELQWCTDNGAMIALAGALRLQARPQAARSAGPFDVLPRWDLSRIDVP
ncbi:MAG: tRNA (adenosine(37)-N6)-threonylcarbamoyltransferase complex transferase subunit TsaD [Thiomonas sp.]